MLILYKETFRLLQNPLCSAILQMDYVCRAAAGAEPDDVILSRVHEVAKPRKVPVFCNTGCNHGNVREKLGNCDGVCMGTAFKKDGVFNGRVDKERVREFMEIVADIRKGL